MKLTKDIFEKKIKDFSNRFPESRHWTEARWEYHQVSINFLERLDAINVLEIGTMGISLLSHSITMDFSVNKDWPVDNPHVEHDCRICPWPFSDEEFDCVVALRVWHHLGDFQVQAFAEAMRIAKWMILAVPETYPKTHLGSRGLSISDVLNLSDYATLHAFERTTEANVYLLKSIVKL